MKTLVIITHRYHYHICQVAILLSVKRFNPDKIAILFDDVVGTKEGWNNLGEKLFWDLRHAYEFKLGTVYTIPFSAFPNVQTEPSGWIRQQYVKLNLHKILSGDEWLVIDGDVLINQDIDPYRYCYVNMGDTFRLHHDWFVRYSLDLGDQRTMFEGNPVEFSSVPIRLLSRKTLESLEEYFYNLHGTDIRSVVESFTLKQNKSKYLELSEYDLIGNYQNFVLKNLLPIKNLEVLFQPSDKLARNWDYLKNKIAVLHGHDNLPKEWYDQFGVRINQEIWEILYNNQKINCDD